MYLWSRVVLISLLIFQCEAYSALWEWWDGTAQCNGKSKDMQWHPLWVDSCITSRGLANDDPIKRTMDYYSAASASISCDSDGKTTLEFFEPFLINGVLQEKVCDAQVAVGHIITIGDETCGKIVEAANVTITAGSLPNTVKQIFSKTKFRCTPCNWVFPNEDPPPYAILASGILVFLFICLFVNVFLKSKLDLLIRDRHIWFPTFFVPPQVPQGGKLIEPGTTVWLTVPEGSFQDGNRKTESHVSLKEKTELPTSEEVLFGLYDIAKALNDDPESYSPSDVHGSFRRASKAQNLSFAQSWDHEKNSEVLSKYGRHSFTKRQSCASAAEPALAEPLLLGGGSPDRSNGSLPTVASGRGVDQMFSSTKSLKYRDLQDSPTDQCDTAESSFVGSPNSPQRNQPRTLTRGNFDTVDEVLDGSMNEGYRKRSIAGTPRERKRQSAALTGELSSPITPAIASPNWKKKRASVVPTSEFPRGSIHRFSDAMSEMSSPSSPSRRQSFPRRKPSAAVSEVPLANSWNAKRRQSVDTRALESYTLGDAAPEVAAENDDLSNNRRKSKPDIFSDDGVIALQEVTSDSDSDVIESYQVHGTVDSDDHIVINLVSNTADDVVNDYVSHAAPKGSKQPAELLMPELSDLSRESPAILSPMSENGTFQNPLKENKSYITPIMSCVVCGKRESSNNPLVKRDQGYKCKGERGNTCIGKRPNQRLLFEGEVQEIDSADVISAAVQGQLGSHGPVRKLRWRDREKEALVQFSSPTAWLPASAVISLDKSNISKISELETKNPQLVSGSYISKEKVATWQYLATEFPYRLTATDASGTWVAIKIESDICVWVSTRCLTKIGDFYGNYGRVGELEAMRVAAFTHWQEWWRDFAQCVGKIQEIKQIQKKTEVRYMVTIQFSESGHNISLPAETFTHATEEEYEKEYLLVPQPVPIRTMSAVFVVHPLLLAGKSLFLIGYFIYIVSSTRSHNENPWSHYQEIYFKLFNSGYPTLMADFGAVFMYRFTHQDVSLGITLRTLGKPVVATLVIAIALSFPGVVTHVIPMLLAYCWLWVPVVAAVVVLIKLAHKFEPIPPSISADKIYDVAYYLENHRGFMIKSAIFHLFYRFWIELLGVIILQTNYNYGVLLYNGFTPYINIILQEYNLRSIACIIKEAAKMITLMW